VYDCSLLVEPKVQFEGDSERSRSLNIVLGTINGVPLHVVLRLTSYSEERQRAIHELRFLLQAGGRYNGLVRHILLADTVCLADGLAICC
jgi:hypothetical protein